jgi:drug/metabolite transporter (DMT)-like permease
MTAAPDDPERLQHELGGSGAMVLATLLWGATFVVLRRTLVRVDPFALVFARFGCATLVFGALLLLRRRRVGRETWLGGVSAGVLMTTGYLFQAIGLVTVPAGTSAFLTSIGTLFAGLFAWPLLGQRPSRVLAIGLLLACAGSALLAEGPHLRLGAGEAWTLAGAFGFALQVVALSRAARHTDTLALAWVQALAVTATMAPFALSRLHSLATLGGADVLRLGYLIVAGSVAAPWLQIRAQRVLSAGRVGLLFALEPVFAVMFALLVGGERYGPPWWAGAALILAAVLTVEGHAAWRAEASRPASR